MSPLPTACLTRIGPIDRRDAPPRGAGSGGGGVRLAPQQTAKGRYRKPGPSGVLASVLLIGASHFACALVGCNGKDAASGADSGVDAPGSADGSSPDAPSGDGGACSTVADASEPVLPTLVDMDGAVPLDAFALDLAIVRCGYWARCSPLAPFVVNTCIEDLRQTPSDWNSGSLLAHSTAIADIFAGIDAGSIAYDPIRADACLESLAAEGCHGPDPEGPECPEVFSCVADAGGGDASDAGTSCATTIAELFGPSTATGVVCSTDQDCMVEGGNPATPYCYAGLCSLSPCGDYPSVVVCGSFVGEGQPCDSDPPFLGSDLPLGSSKPCAAGLTCRGFTDQDAGLGVCAKPQDVHGSCVTGAALTGCATGLICPCGECSLPPSSGPCFAGQLCNAASFDLCSFTPCQYGVAYCKQTPEDPVGTCQPVKPLGANCSDNVYQACASNLYCDTQTNVCSPLP